MAGWRRGVLTLTAVGVAAVLVTAVLGSCAAAVAPAAPLEPWAPAAAAGIPDPHRDYAESRLATMSLHDKVASMVMLHVPGSDPGPLRQQIDRSGVAGLIYLGSNVPGSATALAATSASLSADPGLPVLLAIDQEGGIVRRLPGDEAPGAVQLRELPAESTESAFAERSALVAAAGVSINFGIVADVTADPRSYIRSRVLGDTAESTADRVAAAVAGERGTVLSTLKHFPGHGAVRGDSHVSLPETGMGHDEWRLTQAPPFVAGIDAGAELVMLGHLLFGAIDPAPASLSPEWHRILRDDLGFEGITITDDLSMLERSGVAAYSDPIANGVAALAAGNDLLLYVGPVDVVALADAVVAAVERGEIAEARIDESVLRLLMTRRELSGRSGPYAHCGVVCRELVG